MSESRVDAWLAALDERHLADLTPSEVARALRALSSCYVERRTRIAEGGALETRGKRAAFALFYGPLHFLLVRAIVRALPGATTVRQIVDLGCGTGVAGAAWAIECGSAEVSGIDRHPWVVSEANRTYRDLGIRGRAAQGDFTASRMRQRGAGIVAAYAINEVDPDRRSGVLERLLGAHRDGASILIVEPIARTIARWWDEWARVFERAGGRADEWRFPASLPDRQRSLARAAGLGPRELTARTLWIGGSA